MASRATETPQPASPERTGAPADGEPEAGAVAEEELQSPTK